MSVPLRQAKLALSRGLISISSRPPSLLFLLSTQFFWAVYSTLLLQRDSTPPKAEHQALPLPLLSAAVGCLGGGREGGSGRGHQVGMFFNLAPDSSFPLLLMLLWTDN